MSNERLGIVAIGRNEGERLRLCLESIRDFDCPTIYVDSNSADDSVRLAQSMGVSVHELDASKPCSAARARHEGIQELLAAYPQLEFVFFVDGDCQVESSWPAMAISFLTEHPAVAAVGGRRRESHPESSVYNRLCDHEWDTPVGEAAAVGGDAVYRVTAYREAGGFDPTVTAGEEPELCKRIRDRGWKVCRLAADMTRHDAAMNSFRQWWTRQIRTGYAGYNVERRFGIGIFDRIIKSAWFWGGVLPAVTACIVVVLGVAVSIKWAWIVLVGGISLFGLQIMRVSWRESRRIGNWWASLEFGFFTMVAKVPILLGIVRQIVEKTRGKQARLVEYKAADQLHPQS